MAVTMALIAPYPPSQRACTGDCTNRCIKRRPTSSTASYPWTIWSSMLIFEWHPILCHQTGNDWLEAFEVLNGSGFTNLIWFTKFGAFSQITEVPSHDVLNKMANYCLADIHLDWHWDIVALKSDTIISTIDTALMRFASNRLSRW